MRDIQGKVDIGFVEVLDHVSTYPDFVARAGLTHRLGVVQETFVPGSDNMVFDEALWKTLVDFAGRYDGGGVVTVTHEWKKLGKSEVSLDSFMEAWEHLDDEDRDPPAAIMSRADGRLTLAMITDYWVHAGGPNPYHDSYTYSVFSDRDLGAEVRAFLAAAPAANRWNFAPQPLRPAEDNRVRSAIGKAVSWSLVIVGGVLVASSLDPRDARAILEAFLHWAHLASR